MTNIDFAFLGHPVSLDHVADLLPRLRPDLANGRALAHTAMLAKAFEWSSPFAAQEDLWVPRADGGWLPGKLIICPFLPEHTHSPRQLAVAYQKTRVGIQLACDLGAKIVGLGGFTSIVGGAQEEKLPKEFGIAMTSGNSLTAALAVAQLKTLLSQLDWTLTGRTVAVLGATGDIGRASTLALISELGATRLMLIARNWAKLEAWREVLRRTFADVADLDLQTSTDPKAASRAEVIMAATSAPTPLVAEADLLPGAIVCDIGYPETVAYAPAMRPEVVAFRGGLAQTDYELPIALYTYLPAPNLLYGCFAETIALALAGRYESYSLGQGHVTLERMRIILELARSFGIRPAPLYRGSQLVTQADLTAFVHYASTLRENQ